MSTSNAQDPKGHTSDGGVVVGTESAAKKMVLFEDPQCPYCRQFEEINGDVVSDRISVGILIVEYRMRCFLGQESVRADNALALAAEVGLFDELRKALFGAQPPEGTGGFTQKDLIELGRRVGLTDPEFTSGIKEARYEQWVLDRESRYQREDPQGTPAAWLDRRPVDSGVLFDPDSFAKLIG